MSHGHKGRSIELVEHRDEITRENNVTLRFNGMIEHGSSGDESFPHPLTRRVVQYDVRPRIIHPDWASRGAVRYYKTESIEEDVAEKKTNTVIWNSIIVTVGRLHSDDFAIRTVIPRGTERQQPPQFLFCKID